MNFALTFITDCHGKMLADNTTHNGTLTRVLSAKDEPQARKIGEAMLGEEVYLHEYLHTLVEVTPSEEAIDLVASNAHYTLNRTRDALARNGETTELVYEAGKAVGLEFC